MVRLQQKVNKAATTRQLQEKAKAIYGEAWQPELQQEAYMKGVKDLFDLLQVRPTEPSGPSPYSTEISKARQ